MQFLLGLAAGVLVGLIMEWMIDWGSLFPSRSNGQARRARRRVQDNDMAAPRNPESANPADAASTENNTDTAMPDTASSATQHAHGE